MEDDDKLNEIKEKYGKGEMMTAEVKDILIKVLQDIVSEHQAKRAKITTEQVLEFMKIRTIKVDMPPVLVTDLEPENKDEGKKPEGKKKDQSKEKEIKEEKQESAQEK